ncbi:MAG: glycosyl hydrolase 53 family protein [Reichenbachiella sp.]
MKHFYVLFCALFVGFYAFGQTFYKGVDLSYVNEMEDCGAVYTENGIPKDPFHIMADHGANVVRVRIWHNPQAWSAHPTSYSSYNDAKASIQRAKNLGLNVLLDFHYSDTWTDPGVQIIPSAWENDVNNTSALVTRMYNYTHQVLADLDNEGLMPELVQVGNESNGNMLSHEGDDLYPVDWTRQAAILNAGISAVRDAGSNSSIQPEIVLHVADPNNGVYWFGDATSNGVTDFDIIGLSYYPQWHTGTVSSTGDIIASLKATHNKDVMLVEVGVPWTDDWNDDATNMLDGLPNGYGRRTKPTGQRDWLVDMANEVNDSGGIGMIYWEPAWVSTGCDTEWGNGSHWENATFFDFNNDLILNGGVAFLGLNLGSQVAVTGVIVSPSSATIDEGQTTTLAESISPANATDQSVSWSSSNTSVATVNASGVVTGVSTGSATITVTTTDGGFTATSAITVNGTSPGGNVTFRVDMTGVKGSSGGYVSGDFTGQPWQIIEMTHEGNNIYSYTTTIEEGTTGAYYFLKRNSWGKREIVPSECALQYGTEREYVIGSGTNTFAFGWQSCSPLNSAARLRNVVVMPESIQNELVGSIYPNPAKNGIITIAGITEPTQLKVIDFSGQSILEQQLSEGTHTIALSLTRGLYVLQFESAGGLNTQKLIVK